MSSNTANDVSFDSHRPIEDRLMKTILIPRLTTWVCSRMRHKTHSTSSSLRNDRTSGLRGLLKHISSWLEVNALQETQITGE
jgi:hypothetical protein